MDFWCSEDFGCPLRRLDEVAGVTKDDPELEVGLGMTSSLKATRFSVPPCPWPLDRPPLPAVEVDPPDPEVTPLSLDWGDATDIWWPW